MKNEENRQMGNKNSKGDEQEMKQKLEQPKETLKLKETSEARGRSFRVTITEIRKRTVTVQESELKEVSAMDAEQTVSDWWHNGQIILGMDDFAEVDFKAEECQADTEKPDDGHVNANQAEGGEANA